MRVADQPTVDEYRALDRCLEPLQGRPLALAVSGGPDSMALLWLVATRLRWEDLQADPEPGDTVDPTMPEGPAARPVPVSRASHPVPQPILVLTVDHGLRPASAAEANLVAEEAARLGVPHRTLIWPDPKPRTGIAAAARTARYRLIDDLIEAEASLYPGSRKRALVTAHHLEDQAETVLMRLARGSGVDGLAAMSPMSVWRPPFDTEANETAASSGARRGLELLRPLLDVPKALLRRIVDANAIPYVLDPTNEDTTYERVRIRRALSVLSDLGVSADAVCSSARRIRRARAALAKPFVAALEQVDWGNGIEASLGDLSGLPDEIALRLLAEATARMGGQEAPPALSQLESLLADIGAARRAGSVQTMTLGGCSICYRPGGERSRPGQWDCDSCGRVMSLEPVRQSDVQQHGCPRCGHQNRTGPRVERTTVMREAGRFAPRPLSLEPGQRGTWDRRYVVSVAPEAPGPVAVRPLGQDRFATLRALIPDLGLWPALARSADTQPAVFSGCDLLAVPAYHHLPATFDWLSARLAPAWDTKTGLTQRLYLAQFIAPLGDFDVARGSWRPAP
jgi:tRNA(Ile)-lysidine synthase